MSSDSLCHDLVLKSHAVVEIQIYKFHAIKMKTADGWETRNEITFTLYLKLNTHQRISNRVFRCHQIVCVIFSFK